mmetsp:Transcript_66130/g.123388  ORF Transcript_66130/g.123388 Transcript_66130/m.123388 type:complete len:214 (+) Transcript_66130:57-698(+)
MGAEPVLPLLEAAFSELFGHIASNGNLTKERYEALSDEMRGSMGSTYDTFLKRVGLLGIEVKPELGLTREQYVLLNTKHFAGMDPERLSKAGPEALETVNTMLADLASSGATVEADSGEGLHQRRPEAARWLKERKESEEESEPEGQHGALVSFAVMLALLATWAILGWFAWTAVEAYHSGAFWVPLLLLFCPLPVYFWIKMLKVAIKPRKVS